MDLMGLCNWITPWSFLYIEYSLAGQVDKTDYFLHNKFHPESCIQDSGYLRIFAENTIYVKHIPAFTVRKGLSAWKRSFRTFPLKFPNLSGKKYVQIFEEPFSGGTSSRETAL
jgi:hypothetical protein